jgi:hypothetical protein
MRLLQRWRWLSIFNGCCRFLAVPPMSHVPLSRATHLHNDSQIRLPDQLTTQSFLPRRTRWQAPTTSRRGVGPPTRPPPSRPSTAASPPPPTRAGRRPGPLWPSAGDWAAARAGRLQRPCCARGVRTVVRFGGICGMCTFRLPSQQVCPGLQVAHLKQHHASSCWSIA